jgi:hypothetical protein
MANASQKHDSTRPASLHNSTRTLSNGNIIFSFTSSNFARPHAAPPHTATTHAPKCTLPPPRTSHSPGGGVNTPNGLWRGWILAVNGLALTCKFPEWHSWEGPETATGFIRYMLQTISISISRTRTSHYRTPHQPQRYDLASHPIVSPPPPSRDRLTNRQTHWAR